MKIRLLIGVVFFIVAFCSATIKTCPNEDKWIQERRTALEAQVSQLDDEIKMEACELLELSEKSSEALSASKEKLELAEKYARKSLSAKVCSKANRYSRKARKSYEEFQKGKKATRKVLAKYNKGYASCQEKLSRISQLRKWLGESEKDPYRLLEERYGELQEARKDLSSFDKQVSKELKKAEKYSENLFNEYYPLLVRLVACEAGANYCPDEDQFYVINVVENRVESKLFPNTPQEVIFQEGQYAPTWDGSWGRVADSRTQRNVKRYLLGKIKTGMPSNVLYQAAFVQGDYVWRYIPNSIDDGSYYCGVYVTE